MTELWSNFGFLFVCSVFLTTAVAEEVLPPENVTLSWSKDLYPQLTWAPPKHKHRDCSYRIKTTRRKDHFDELEWPNYKSLHLVDLRYLNGGYLNISIETVCNGSSSKARFIGLNDPDMKLKCVLLTSVVHCYWDPPPSAQLQLFYNVPVASRSQDFTELRECPRYSEGRDGCDIPVKTKNWTLDLLEPINLLLIGTLGKGTIRNIHQILDIPSVKLKWEVKASGKQFFINWTPLAFNKNWTYKISYTLDNCDRRGKFEIGDLGKPPYELERQAHCSYDISMRGETTSGETEWTKTQHYDAVPYSGPPLWLLVLIPLVLAVMVVLLMLWWRRNKEKLWPKIPQPNSKIFQDLMNNNNKANFYLPKVEEECDVTLVIDPKQAEL